VIVLNLPGLYFHIGWRPGHHVASKMLLGGVRVGRFVALFNLWGDKHLHRRLLCYRERS
jgi:hypothetical protein